MSNEINLRTARNNDTLLWLISEKLTEENGGKKVNVNSVWNQILDVVDEQQQESGDVYSGGNERKNWSKNYLLLVGKTVTFSKEMWNKIKNIVGLSSEKQIVNSQENSVSPEIDLTSGNYEKNQVVNSDGMKKYVLNVEGQNVRYSSMDVEYNSKGKLIGYIQHFPEGDMAFDAEGNLLPNGVLAVEIFKNEQEQMQYRQALSDAIDILSKQGKELGLSDKELEFIKNIQIESINTGAARFDRKRNVLLFNINDRNVPNKNELVKIIIHELTHATNGHPEGKNSQKEERMCETRAIKSALKLIQAGVIDDFQIPFNPPIYISSLSTDKQIDEYVSEWLVMCRYTSLPEEIK